MFCRCLLRPFESWHLLVLKHSGVCLYSFLPCNRKEFFQSCAIAMIFSWNSDVIITFPNNNHSVSTFPYARGPGRHIWDLICVMNIRQSLFLIISWTWRNNGVNSASSGINSEVSICKITLFAYHKSIPILRSPLKSLSTENRTLKQMTIKGTKDNPRKIIIML